MRAHRILAGFTLIELLITLAIIGLLASLAVPVAQTVLKREKEQELRYALRDIRFAIDLYKRAYDDGRMPRVVGDSGYPKNLRILVDGVVDQTDPRGRKIHFLRHIPRDPMNTDVTLDPDKTWGLRCYASDADSPSEGADVFDVYSLSLAVGLNGAPYNTW